MEQINNPPAKNVFEALGVEINKSVEKSNLVATEFDAFISSRKQAIKGNMELLTECVNNTISVYEEIKAGIMDKRAELVLQLSTFDQQLKAINIEVAKLRNSTSLEISQTLDTSDKWDVRIIEANIAQAQVSKVKIATKRTYYSTRQAMELILPCFLQKADDDMRFLNKATFFDTSENTRKPSLALYIGQLYKRILSSDLIDTETGLLYAEEKTHLANATIKHWLDKMLKCYFEKVDPGNLTYIPNDARITTYYRLSPFGYNEAIKIQDKIDKLNKQV
jgi:hypothetical protein